MKRTKTKQIPTPEASTEPGREGDFRIPPLHDAVDQAIGRLHVVLAMLNYREDFHGEKTQGYEFSLMEEALQHIVDLLTRSQSKEAARRADARKEVAGGAR